MFSQLLEKKQTILNQWVEAIAQTYPAETAFFLRKDQNRFSNPVAYGIASGAAALLDGLLDGRDVQSNALALDEVLRVRAVQAFTPSEAVGFIFQLKPIVLSATGLTLSDCADFFERVDRLALEAFDAYAQCREQLFQARLNDSLGRPSPAFTHVMGCSSGTCTTCDSEARD